MKLRARHDPVLFAQRMLGLTLYDWQAEFLRAQAALLLDPRTKTTGSTAVGCCGRQSGKSTANAVSLLWYAVAWPGSRQLCVAPIAPQSKLIWQAASELLHGSVLEATYTVEIRQSDYPSVTIAVDGQQSHIDFRSVGLDSGRLRGPHASRIFGDEAARIAGGVFTSDLLPMMSAQVHRQLVLTSTPLFQGDYFHGQWLRGQDAADSTTRSFQFPSTANPMITSELLESYRTTMSDEAYMVEFEAAFVDGAGNFFPWAVIQRAIDPDITPGYRSGCTYAVGFDQAQRRDRSGVAVLECTAGEASAEAPWRIVEVLDVVKVTGGEWRAQAKFVAGLARRYGGAVVTLDITHNSALADMLREEGCETFDYRFTSSPTQKAALLDRMKAMMEDGSLVLCADPDLERELRFYQRQVSERGRVTLGAPSGSTHFDDLTTAVALSLEYPAVEGSVSYPFSRYLNNPEWVASVLGPKVSEQGVVERAAETAEERAKRRYVERCIWDESRWS